MTDERDTSFFDDGSPRPRRRHPAVDRGHSVIRDQQAGGGWPDDPYAADPARYAEPYPESQYSQPGHYSDPAYPPQYDNGGYGDGYPDEQYGGPARYDQSPREPGYPPAGYPSGAPGGGGYGPPADPRAPGGYGPTQSYPDPYAQDPFRAGGAPAGGYPGSFIEHGFDESSTAPTGRRDTDGRGRRDTDGRGRQPTDGRGRPPFDDRGRGATDGRGRTMPRANGYAGAPPHPGQDYPTNGRGMRDTDGRGRPRGFADLAGPERGGGYGDDYSDAPIDATFGAEKPRRKGRSLVTLIVVLVMLAAIGGVGAVGYKYVKSHFSTPDYTGNGTGTVSVIVAKGDSATQIGNTLVKAGVVKSTKAFINAAEADAKSKNIQVGTYSLHKQMSAKNALLMLEAVGSDGQPLNALVLKVTIPEGDISLQIYALLSAKTHIPVADFKAAAADPVALGVSASWFTAHRGDGRKSLKSIEGFLFPATYTFSPGETAKQMLTDMVSKFNSEIGPSGVNLMSVAAGTLHISPYEVLIAASIAQVEGVAPGDMAGITRVLYNRVYKDFPGHKLEIDSSVNYYLRIEGKAPKDSSQLTQSQLHDPKDPYNTHDVGGFPPGAISNPGLSALKAAVTPNPAQALDYYFQSLPPSTKVVFAKTCKEAGQQRGVADCTH